MQEGMRYTKRCRRWDIPGQAHALTFSCYHNHSFLSQERTCVWLAEALDRARERYGFELWTYVFMPNHVHLVLHPTREEYSISRMLLAIKQPVSRKVLGDLRAHHPEALHQMATGQRNRPYRFWQNGGGYDRNITQVDTLIETVRYIHNNPVRQGLVATATEWRYSSAAAWEGKDTGLLTIDRDSFPAF